jgi:hypothetical protein
MAASQPSVCFPFTLPLLIWANFAVSELNGEAWILVRWKINKTKSQENVLPLLLLFQRFAKNFMASSLATL